MAENIFGGVHMSSDVATSDLSKGRYLGFESYISYRKFCTGRSYNTFWDLKDVISAEVN